MPFSEYLSQALLDHTFGAGAYTVPTIYVALLTASTPTECTGTDYVRVAAAAWAGAAGVIDNDATIEFPEAGASDWGTITHAAIYDEITAGNLLATVSLDTSKEITAGEVARFNAGELNITLS